MHRCAHTLPHSAPLHIQNVLLFANRQMCSLRDFFSISTAQWLRCSADNFHFLQFARRLPAKKWREREKYSKIGKCFCFCGRNEKKRILLAVQAIESSVCHPQNPWTNVSIISVCRERAKLLLPFNAYWFLTSRLVLMPYWMYWYLQYRSKVPTNMAKTVKVCVLCMWVYDKGE